MDHCLAPDCQMGGLGCDNMTAILVCLLNEQSYEELAAKCSTPVRPEVLEKYNSEHGLNTGMVTPSQRESTVGEVDNKQANGTDDSSSSPTETDEQEQEGDGQMDEEMTET